MYPFPMQTMGVGYGGLGKTTQQWQQQVEEAESSARMTYGLGGVVAGLVVGFFLWKK